MALARVALDHHAHDRRPLQGDHEVGDASAEKRLRAYEFAGTLWGGELGAIGEHESVALQPRAQRHGEHRLVDDDSWAITGMVVDTRNWLPGRKVMVPPSAISGIDWERSTVNVR
ncbi:MAG TPA: hypothetical protein VFX94_06175 [Burkholderiales bacterium]|nr:hypothetical protein [Burkholderiales bacterium]